jgi:short-subunit dehydrogenase
MTFSRAIIVGGSSGMGKELARLLAADGCQVALVARRQTVLELVARQLGPKARIYPHDVHDAASVPALFQTICHDLGGLDLIVYAAGVMPRITVDEYDFAKDQEIVAVNVLGAIAWLNEAAVRFSAAGAGTIVGIGSVAGDRGRAPQPVYGMSKAALETYLEALRNRVGSQGVRVVTIKPGPVATPLTEGLDALPLVIPADEAARQILAAIRAGRRVVYVPKIWRPIMGLLRAIPSPLFQRLKR